MPQAKGLWWGVVLGAGALCAITFLAGGGLSLGSMTTVEIALTLGGGAIVVGALLVGALERPAPHPHAGEDPSAEADTVVLRSGAQPSKSRPRPHGLLPAGLLVALAALSALSVVWSVSPDASWQEANRVFAYSAIFAGSVALAQLAPERWPALLGAVTLAAAVVSVYALATKVFPAQLDPHETYARLQAPFGYWNATGLTAAMGVMGALWLGARRAGGRQLSALAYPAMGLALVTLLLTYSRGAVAALAIGLLLWFCMVPLRLRGAAVLIAGALASAPVVAWAFSRRALSSDNVALAQRSSAGHQLGVLLAAMLLALLFVGVAVGFLTGRRAPSPRVRRGAGLILVGGLILVALAGAGALAASHRGLSGSISHDLGSLTNPHAPIPPNTPSRLTAIGSVRARYWNEALKIFKAHPAVGAGGGGYETARLRYRTETLAVKHAHGFIVQTMADLGLVGLALAIALFGAWAAAAGRGTHPFNRRWRAWRWRAARAPYSPERIGLLSMLALVVVFGVHSLVDWTWYVPGDACAALLCAGWLAGRGSLGHLLPARAASFGALRQLDWRTLGWRRAGVVAAVVVAALLAAWAQWQPERSAAASDTALEELARSPGAARSSAQAAVSEDPLSAQARLALAAVQQSAGEGARAEATLQDTVRLQPSNPQTWVALGEYDLQSGNYAAAADELRAAVYLNPEAVAPEPVIAGVPGLLAIRNEYLQALRALAAAHAARSKPARAPRRTGPTRAHGSARRRTLASRRALAPRRGSHPARTSSKRLR